MAEAAEYPRDLLYESAKDGNLAGLELALRRGDGVNDSFVYDCEDNDFETALHVASRNGHFAIVKVLLDAGADIDSRDSGGGTPLHDACIHGRLVVVKELVRRGADIYPKDNDGETPFDFAGNYIHSRDDIMEYLLQHYREEIFESEGRRSLLTILKQGELVNRLPGRRVRLSGTWAKLQIGTVRVDQLVSLLRYFVEHDPDSIHEQDDAGDLPLHIACRRLGLHEVIQYLLEQDPTTMHISNNSGALPIHMACQFGASLPIIKYLIEENGGAGTLSARDNRGSLPIHLACSRHHAPFEIIQYLGVHSPSTLFVSNNNGALPIHLACQFGASLPIIKDLVEGNGGTAETLQAPDNNGYLPLHTLCGSNNPSLATVQYLVQTHAAALWTRSFGGDLPVTLACESASLNVIYTLIRGDPHVVES